MIENILIGFVGAVIALAIRELWAFWLRARKRKRLAALCERHLMQIHKDLSQHVKVEGKLAKFNSTLYCEIVVGDFLYESLVSNLDLFPNIGSLHRTITFFHHYKINMSTVKSRLEESKDNETYLTEGTYSNLLGYLEDAISELRNIAGT